MTMKKIAIATAAAVGFSLASFGAAQAADQQFISIGTGGVTGVYYPTGGAICRLVNKERKRHGIRCSVESTGGSVYNINTIRAGELEFGVAQSDWQYHAYNGTSKFEEAGPFKELRAMFSVHAEPISLVARAESGITSIDDLKGKRVNIGNPGSGTEATWNVVWGAMGLTNDDLALASGLKSSETPSALCDNKIDAFFWLVGNPSALNSEAATTCDVVFASVDNDAAKKLIADNPFYRDATIPGGMYKGNPDDVTTMGVGATFVSSTAVSDDVAYEIAKAVLGNLDDFRKLHPAFAHLKAEDMVSKALSAPLHPGALKAYKELGLK